jgi:hypothetical protein
MLSDEQKLDIKSRHPLKEFLASLGMEFESAAHGCARASCPFHQEKTASFTVYPDHHYYCFGCGAVGDIFSFLKETQGMNFRQAAEHLNGSQPVTVLPRPAPAVAARPHAPAQRLSESRWQRWEESCERLISDGAAIEHISQWRGYSQEIIVNAAKHRLMGLWTYWNEVREAFLITAPAHCCEEPSEDKPKHWDPVPVGIHVRLAPHSTGNSSNKVAWHYDPKSTPEKPIHSWPFLWGNPIGARWRFPVEGQWDALALADALGWRSPDGLPPGCAIVGIRGSSGTRRYLHDFQHDPKGTDICIGDNDRAGESWHHEGGFLDQLRAQVARVISFRPNEPGNKDLNDLYKNGHFQGEEFLAMLRHRLQPNPRRAKRETFLQFCRANLEREDEIGRAARFVVKDKTRPKGRKPLRRWRAHWECLGLAPDLVNALENAMRAWCTSAPAADEIIS